MRVIATAGHVDHGKSTLLRLLTGQEPDRWAEEHRRGMTIDLGFAWTRSATGTLAFVDVPGHERFVPNMLAGVGPVPAVMLVVAADEGWMPQTTEHVGALDALGVEHGLLVITRSDLADPEPADERARRHLEGTTLAGLPSVHVSGATGQGLEQLRTALAELSARLPDAAADADVRLWVDRAFAIRGAGTVVTGTLPAGRLRTGQELRLHPGGRSAVVRGLQCLGAAESEVEAVARVAVNLRGVDHDELGRGHALLTPGRWLSTEEVDVRLRGDGSADLPRELVLHTGSAAVTARVRPLGADTARLRLRRALPLRIGDRALLRDPGAHRIAAGVVVLDVRPPALRRRGAARERARVLEGMDGRADGSAELRRRQLVRRDELEAMGARAPFEPAGDWLADPSCVEQRGRRLVQLLDEQRASDPLADGMPAEAARRALELPEPALLDAVLRTSAAAGVTRRDGRLHHGSAALPDRVREAVEQLRRDLADDPFQAPTADDLRRLGLGERELAAAERAGALLRLAPGLVLLPDAEDEALERLAELDAPFTPSQARRALGTTRRVAVPLLERLEARGATRRSGAGHCLR
jgi:selenocysteine-specific elongation factor